MLLFLAGCKSYQGSKVYFDRSNRDCEIEILSGHPKYKAASFEEIGKCKGRGAIMINDGSEKALNRVMKCACQHGGNAILITKFKDAGYYGEDAAGFTSFTGTGKVYEAIVIRLKY